MEDIITIEVVAQFGISALGILAIVLVAKENRWGFVVGLMSQPFWLITSYNNEQWGVFVLCFFYLGSWSYGIYNNFYKTTKIKPARELVLFI
ncbi:nicotinamide mononucleotide transporter [Candidatus Nomurabacteria bacterium]|nr:nicotinamide mononucleotide transporter [Candidatus Kaiserbacteria bacterium]MCB9810038.1 nicotinamide mononucleotide transporter [Candidatus Nomurabacteria bacterium]